MAQMASTKKAAYYRASTDRLGKDDFSMNFPRFVVAGTRSGSGKTTLALALMALFSREGLDVRPFKMGPDYIDPSFHARAAGRPSRNLDAWLMPDDAVRRLFFRHAAPEGLAIIEGVMGLFDGLGAGARCSTAHIASLTESPVILILDAGGTALSAAALVSGFAAFRPKQGPPLNGMRIAGIIINRVSGTAHYDLLRRCIEENTAVPCLGYLLKNAVPPLPDRHLGLVPAGEHAALPSYLDRLADAAAHSIDAPALLAIARQAAAPGNSCCVEANATRMWVPPTSVSDSQTLAQGSQAVCPPRYDTEQPLSPVSHLDSFNAGRNGRPDTLRVRLGVARDKAFSFYYPDNLELLEHAGAELRYFSPLEDQTLPEGLDGLYLGGGFPEIFAERLETNAALRHGIREVLQNDMPAFAECGGMLYLCSGLTIPGRETSPARRYAMVGFFPHEAEMADRLQPFGYVTATLLHDCLLGRAGTSFPAHEFHYSRLIGSGTDNTMGHTADDVREGCLRLEKVDGRHWAGGLMRNNVLAVYPHVHFHGCPEAARSFLAACREYKARSLHAC